MIRCNISSFSEKFVWHIITLKDLSALNHDYKPLLWQPSNQPILSSIYKIAASKHRER